MSYAIESKSKWSARRSVQPAIEPVTLGQAKEHCKITSQDNEAELSAFISVAREAAENYLNRTLITTTWVLRIEELCGEILVPHSPLISVSQIEYDAADGTPTVLAGTEYQVDAYSEPGRIKPAYNKFWPIPRNQYNAVRVTFTAGYGATTADVPAPIKHAILVMVNTLDLHREKVLTGLSKTEVEEVAGYLLYPYRVWWM